MKPLKKMLITTTLYGFLASCTSNNLSVTGPEPIAPDAGNWKTYVIASGDQYRLESPPGGNESDNELEELRRLTASRSDEDLVRITYWNTGAPGYRWNEIAVSEANNSDILLDTYRLISYLNVAIYDATVAAWDSKYAHNRPRPTEVNPGLDTALPTPGSPSWPAEHAVAAGAAEAVLSHFLPDRAEKFRMKAEEAAHAFVMAGLHYPSDARAGLELGRKVGAKMVEYALADGSDTEWTGERPDPAYGIFNLPSMGDEAIPYWKTWVLSSSDEFRSPPPPAPDSRQRRDEITEILNFQKERDNQPFSEIFFWPEDPNGRPEPGTVPLTYSQVVYYYAPLNTTLWVNDLQKKLFEYRWTDNPPQAAYAYALVAVASYDSFLANWDGRFAYWVARPAEMEPAIKPILPTYPTPEYPSGHSSHASATYEVMAYLFPPDAAYFRSKTLELAESRIWAGIHFRSSVEAGVELGEKVAGKVITERGMGNRP